MPSRRPWLSVRHLAHSPWARLMLVALALVQIIAPSWHVCDLGGGSMPCGHPMAGMAHGFPVATGQGREPVICVCRDEKPANPPAKQVQVAGRDADCHVQCLALLLQSMPGQWAVSHQLFVFAATHRRVTETRETLVALQTLRHYRGRAPPVTL